MTNAIADSIACSSLAEHNKSRLNEIHCASGFRCPDRSSRRIQPGSWEYDRGWKN